MAHIRNDLPEPQKSRLAHAVCGFRDRNLVRVTPDDLQAFLEATGDIDSPPASRLRWLAIELEFSEFEKGWNGLRAIYEAAAKADATDSRVFHSWGISATEWAEERRTTNLRDRLSIASEAERVLHTALELVPQDSEIAHAMGLLYYNHPARTNDVEVFRSQAITWFSQAVAWDPRNTIAQLYIAHCFHDRKDWTRAVIEYNKVDLNRLASEWPMWRVVKCREQLATCYAYAGDKDQAVARFTALLDDVESWDAERLEEYVVNVDELVQAVTEVLDDSELLRRTRAMVDRLGLGSWYRELLLQSSDEGILVADGKQVTRRTSACS